MLSVIGSAFGAVAEIGKYLNTKASRKYIDKMAELKRDLYEEEAKGADADDAKIETLYKEISIVFDAMREEITLAAVKSS